MESGEITKKEDLLEVIAALLGPDSSIESKHDANSLLTQFYLSPLAWKVAKEMLEKSEEYDSNTLFTVGKLLRVKALYYFSELPENEYLPLFEFVLKTLKMPKAKPARLMLADILAIIYMRVYPIHRDLLGLLAQHFSDDSDSTRNLLLEILKVIPEQMVDERIVIEDELRAQFIEFVTKELQTGVLKTLDIASQRPNLSENQKYQLLKCFEAWLIDETSEEIKADIHNLNLVNLAFSELANPDGCSEEAKDVLITLMVLCRQSEKYSNLYAKFVVKQQELSLQFDHLINTSERDEVQYFLEVYNVFFLRVLGQVLKEPSVPMVNTILNGIFLRVFHEKRLGLQKHAANIFVGIVKKLTPGDKSSEEERAQKKAFIQVHSGLFKNLIEKCIENATLTSKHIEHYEENPVDSDEEDDNEEYIEKNILRSEIYYLLKKMTQLIGFHDIFEVIAAQIKETVAALQNPENANKQESLFILFEAQLFCANSLMRKTYDKSEAIYQQRQYFLEMVLCLNFTKHKILYTALRIISNSSEFFGSRIDLLQKAFKLLHLWIQNEKFESEAAEAMNNLCQNNKNFVIEKLQDFFDFYSKVCYKKEIVIGLTKVIDEYPDKAHKTNLLRHLCKPFGNEILLLSKQDPSNQKSQMFNTVIKNLEMLELIVKNLSPADPDVEEHVLVDILTELWPLLQEYLLKFYDECDIVECITKFLKYVMRSITRLFGPFMEPYFKIMTENYQKKPVSTYLYSVEVALTIFYRTPEYQSWLENIFNMMNQQTCIYLKDKNIHKIDPDLLDDFFGLIVRYLRYMPEVVLNCPTLKLMLEQGTALIGIQTVHAAKALYQFFEEVFKVCQPGSQLRGASELLRIIAEENFGTLIISKMMQEFVTCYPQRIVRDFMDDVFMKAISLHQQNSIIWFSEALKPIPQNILNPGEKNSFIGNLSSKAFQGNESYFVEFFEKFYKRAKTHNSKIY